MLVATGALFAGTHLALSHPLRDAVVDRVGPRGFQAIYSLVALATFILFIHAYARAPDAGVWWTIGERGWLVATIVMWLASVLLAGSVVGNPALPGPAPGSAAPRAQGVFAITRHPMMWAIALWAAVHLAVIANAPAAILAVVMAGLALGGSWGQDRKKARLEGRRWREWTQRTSFMPFGAIITGRRTVADMLARPGIVAIVTGSLLWLIATWAHGRLGWQAAGLFRWVG